MTTTLTDTVEIEWPSVVGKHYQLQSRLAIEARWTNEGDPIAVTGQPISVFERASEAEKFYRMMPLG